MNRYRTHQQILADVLVVIDESTRDGIAVTKLCHKSNVPYGRLKKIIHALTSSGNINQIEYDGKNTFVLTEKGRHYLQKYKQFSDIAEGFGLEM